MADKGNDPAEIWRTMIGEMEKGFNSFANQTMTSPEFSKVMNQVGGVSAGAQKQLGELMEKYLLAMNLPSRAQMVGMAERIQAIEGQLNEIKALLHQVHHNSLAQASGHGRAAAAAHQASAIGGRAEMNAPAAGLDLASISERIQSEVQRAIQRSIKGVEYISSSGPSLGSTPKDILAVRGTMNLYHYRPMADEIYRVPILIVMATTNRGYILDMVPGQSFIEFLLKRGYDVYMLDWTAPKPEEKSLRMEDYVLDFIPDCIRRVQQDSGETRRHRDRLLLRRRAVAAVRLDLQRRADEEPDLLHHADRFPRDEAVLEFLGPPLFRRRPAGRQRRQRAAGNDPVSRSKCCGRRRAPPARCSCGKTSGTTNTSRPTG